MSLVQAGVITVLNKKDGVIKAVNHIELISGLHDEDIIDYADLSGERERQIFKRDSSFPPYVLTFFVLFFIIGIVIFILYKRPKVQHNTITTNANLSQGTSILLDSKQFTLLENPENIKVQIEVPCFLCLNHYTQEEKITKLSCGHIIHSICINNWVSSNNNTCPICVSIEVDPVPQYEPQAQPGPSTQGEAMEMTSVSPIPNNPYNYEDHGYNVSGGAATSSGTNDNLNPYAPDAFTTSALQAIDNTPSYNDVVNNTDKNSGKNTDKNPDNNTDNTPDNNTDNNTDNNNNNTDNNNNNGSNSYNNNNNNNDDDNLFSSEKDKKS